MSGRACVSWGLQWKRTEEEALLGVQRGPLSHGIWQAAWKAGCGVRVPASVHSNAFQCPVRLLQGTGDAVLGGLGPRAPQLEETPETPPSSRAEGLLFLHGLESNPGSSLQTEEEAGLP